MARPVGEAEARFWAKVDKSGECWLWTASLTRGGYGQFALRHGVADWSPRRAHKFAWEVTFGKVPEGIQVCHRCDVRRCVRPDHLFLGTAADNTEDCRRKGRLTGRSRRLSPHQLVDVVSLRAFGAPVDALADAFEVHRMTIYRALESA